MGKRIEAALLNEKSFLWGFRTSALAQLFAIIPMLFLFMQIFDGTFQSRFSFISNNPTLMMFSWISAMIQLLSLFYIFTVLLFYFESVYRIILRWAWFICVIAIAGGLIFYIIQMTIIPTLLQLIVEMSFVSVSIIDHLKAWDRFLFHMGGIFVPTCFAIGGLIYTAVMFRSDRFPDLLCFWSFLVWTSLLILSLLFPYISELFLFFLSAIILLLIPWLWQVGALISTK